MVTVPEAARRTGRHPETIRRWIRECKLPARKVGTQHLIDQADLAHVLGVAPDALGPAPEWPTAAGGPPVRPTGRAVGEAAAPYGIAALDPAKYRHDWLPAIVGRIVRLVDPERIVLFGSRAIGRVREDSDYDLLVVLDAVGHRRQARIAIGRAIADLPVAADVVVATAAEIDPAAKPRGVLYWALREGRTVYERPR